MPEKCGCINGYEGPPGGPCEGTNYEKNGRNDEKNNRHSLLFRLFILTNFPDNNIV